MNPVVNERLRGLGVKAWTSTKGLFLGLHMDDGRHVQVVIPLAQMLRVDSVKASTDVVMHAVEAALRPPLTFPADDLGNPVEP